MTAKDQAIAPDLSSMWMKLEKANKPAPDCRTCADYDRLEGCLRAPRYGVCTNGDQYQEASKVVLWRTE